MPVKDSKPNSSRLLINSYIRANKMVFHSRAYVPKKYHDKFAVLEKQLLMEEHSPNEYAVTVVKIMESWARRKGLDRIPFNMFLSEYAQERYYKVVNSKTVSIKEDDNSSILYSEVLAARKFIIDNLSHRSVSFKMIVQELKPLLDVEWVELYEKGDRTIKKDALDILKKEFGVSKSVHGYLELLEAIQ